MHFLFTFNTASLKDMYTNNTCKLCALYMEQILYSIFLTIFTFLSQ